MFSTKTKQSLCSSILTTAYKNSFYQKSLPIKTDFSLYRREFKLWHPRYFDVARWSEYQKKKRDYKKLRFNTQDPLHFDYNMKNVNGGFELVRIHILHIYPLIVIGKCKKRQNPRDYLLYLPYYLPNLPHGKK